MITCPLCQFTMCEYNSDADGYTVKICWNCGHYESNSPAYREHPEFFKNMVRENPIYFFKKYLGLRASDKFLQHLKSDEDLTECATEKYLYL